MPSLIKHINSGIWSAGFACKQAKPALQLSSYILERAVEPQIDTDIHGLTTAYINSLRYPWGEVLTLSNRMFLDLPGFQNLEGLHIGMLLA